MAFTFMMSMIKKDMHHMLVEAMKRGDPIKMYREIQKHYKGGKQHHVETARRMLEAHRLGPAGLVETIGADLSSRKSLKDGDARIPEVRNP